MADSLVKSSCDYVNPQSTGRKSQVVVADNPESDASRQSAMSRRSSRRESETPVDKQGAERDVSSTAIWEQAWKSACVCLAVIAERFQTETENTTTNIIQRRCDTCCHTSVNTYILTITLLETEF